MRVRFLKPGMLLLLLLFVVFAGTTAVYCQTWVVRTNIDNYSEPGEGPLRYAIECALSGDVITFDLTYPATITLDGHNLLIDKGITIRGPGADQLSISGNRVCRVFSIVEAESVEISGLSIIRGKENYGGGIACSNSSPRITDCIFFYNKAVYYGGGLFNIVGSNPIVTNCTFEYNWTDRRGGGAIMNNASHPFIKDCTFYFNDARDEYYGNGGAIYNVNSKPALEGCTFESNGSACVGGALYNEFSSPDITNCTFYNSCSATVGGGMYNGDSSPTLTHCTFSENRAVSYGRGIYNEGNSSPTLTNCILWDEGGSEIFNDASSNPTISYCIVQNGDVGDGAISSDIITEDPLLMDLADNGGPTWTCALQKGSSAIDTGVEIEEVTTDQRGVLRPQKRAYDIGAYEFEPGVKERVRERKREQQLLSTSIENNTSETSTEEDGGCNIVSLRLPMLLLMIPLVVLAVKNSKR